MRIAELIQRWGQEGHAHPDARTYTVHLPLRDAARVEALRVMYPDCSDSQLIADLIRAAGAAGVRNYAAYSFVAMHTRHLMGELGVTGDIALLSTALLAPLELPILDFDLEDIGE